LPKPASECLGPPKAPWRASVTSVAGWKAMTGFWRYLQSGCVIHRPGGTAQQAGPRAAGSSPAAKGSGLTRWASAPQTPAVARLGHPAASTHPTACFTWGTAGAGSVGTLVGHALSQAAGACPSADPGSDGVRRSYTAWWPCSCALLLATHS